MVAGKGYDEFEGLETQCNDLRAQGTDIELHRDVSLMSEIMAVSDTKMPANGIDDPAIMWNSLRQTGGGALFVPLLSPPKTSISVNRRIDAPR